MRCYDIFHSFHIISSSSIQVFVSLQQQQFCYRMQFIFLLQFLFEFEEKGEYFAHEYFRMTESMKNPERKIFESMTLLYL